MIAPIKKRPCQKPHPAWHAAFLAILPNIRTHARIAFRHLDPEAREDAVQEVIANCVVAYARLVELGKADLAYAGVLARFAVAQIHAGRKVGTPLRSNDVLSHYAQQRRGLRIERLVPRASDGWPGRGLTRYDRRYRTVRPDRHRRQDRRLGCRGRPAKRDARLTGDVPDRPVPTPFFGWAQAGP